MEIRFECLLAYRCKQNHQFIRWWWERNWRKSCTLLRKIFTDRKQVSYEWHATDLCVVGRCSRYFSVSFSRAICGVMQWLRDPLLKVTTIYCSINALRLRIEIYGNQIDECLSHTDILNARNARGRERESKKWERINVECFDFIFISCGGGAISDGRKSSGSTTEKTAHQNT